MQRSAGVTAIAVVAIIGGALTCLFALFAAFAAVMMQHMPQLPDKAPAAVPTAVLGVEAAVFLGIGAWTIASAIGLLRLKNWARISTLILGGLLAGFAFFGLLGAVMITVMPMPAPPGKEVPHSFMAAVGAIMAAWCLIQMAVGIWWLVLLNRKAVKEQFLGEGITQAVGGLPVSITIIGWYMTVGGAISVLGFLLSSRPALLFGVLIHGWPAKAFYLFYSLACLALGVGLLHLKPLSHALAIYFYLFSLLNIAVNSLLPGARGRIEALIQETLRGDPAWLAGVMRYVIWGANLFGTLAVLIQLWFLITRK